DKLFYFGTYQGTIARNVPSGRIQFVPTAEQRAGDFSSVPKQLIDPVSRQPLMNNQIPSSRFSPVSQFFLNRIPLPNGPNGQLTFPGTPIAEDENQFMGKADYTSGNHTLSGRYYFTDFDAPPVVGPENILAATSAGNAVRVQNVSFNHTYTFSPTFLLNSTFGLNRQRGGSLSSTDFGLADAGAKVIGPESVEELNSPPELVVSVTDGFSISTNHLGDFDRGDTTFRGVATKISGSHEIRFGGEAVRVWNKIINTFQMAGQSQFNGQLSGNGLSDFMFGRLSQFRQGGGEFKDLIGVKWGFFVQDNWRVTPRLSLNLGLRWDPFLPYYDREGRVVCYDPGFPQTSARFPNAPQGFLFGGDDADPGCPQGGFENNWANFGPRVGIAYRLTEDGKTSLRTGGGIYFTPIQSSEMNPFTNIAPFAGTFTLNDVAFEDPFGSAGLENPFPNNFGNTLPGPDFQFAPINDIRRYFAPDFKIVQLATWTVRL
ncbi:MAG TPA: TonB-dependent receptor, partial [Verrucomicrobiae bacterium]|nr:TonB-dependent receptor [Verrucomicrobiae bacterium]